MMDQLTLELFLPVVGQQFQLPFDGGVQVPLLLQEASPLRIAEYPGRTRNPFSLKFRGPAEFMLVQRVYHMIHPTMGDMSMFIVPIGKEPEGYLYQAVFN